MLSAIGVNLALACVESAFYGIFFVLATTSLAVLVGRHSNRSSSHNGPPAPSSKPLWRSPLLIATVMLLMTVTAHWILTVRRLFEAFLYHTSGGEPTRYYLTVEAPTQVASTAFVVSSVIVGDLILTYRIWVVWDRRLSMIVFPMLCTLGYVAMGISVIQLFAIYTPMESIFVHAAQRRIITTAALTLSTNIYGTGSSLSIAYRIWTSNRAVKHEGASLAKGLPEALVIFIESAALYTFWTLFFLVSYSSNSLLEAFAFHCIPAATGLSFTLIIARIGLGWSRVAGDDVELAAGPRWTMPQGQDSTGTYPLRVIAVNVRRTVEQEAVPDFSLHPIRTPEKSAGDLRMV
ncbi:hypothetical protein GY45DRAFT_1256114 [Cubamyces sp. BRFM 1775]|nr:hypothetical protein GY45DRAFT_1256114 [Cubamyces sp. BRFM 1775]